MEHDNATNTRQTQLIISFSFFVFFEKLALTGKVKIIS